MAIRYRTYDRASGMGRPRLLNDSNLASVPATPGVYLLLSARRDGTLTVRYVGKGVNLARRLAQHKNDGYTHFRYATVTTKLQAFHAECAEFHRYGKADHLDNVNHPARPKGYKNLAPCNQDECNGEACE